jgi:hypothetical protein
MESANLTVFDSDIVTSKDDMKSEAKLDQELAGETGIEFRFAYFFTFPDLLSSSL